MEFDDIYLPIATTIMIIICLISTVNVLTNRLTSIPVSHTGPQVSVLLPARNEEKDLGACLDSLCNQNYTNYEIHIMDDDSSDDTYTIANAYADKYAFVHVHQTKSLPSQWYGKTHAVHQLYLKSKGDILILTDADTIHGADSISYGVSALAHHDCDLISGFARQTMVTQGEKLAVPVMYVVKMYLVYILVKFCGSERFSFAIGQYICITRKAMDHIGGMTMFKTNVCEDLLMAAAVKSHGFKMAVVPLTRHVSCRMFVTYYDCFVGLSRGVFTALQSSVLLTLVNLIVLTMLILYPPFRIVHDLFAVGNVSIGYVTLVAIFVFSWTIVLADEQALSPVSMFFPALAIQLFLMAVYSASTSIFSKGFQWKGRYVK
ncbi:hypothetical protein HDE_10807 [Halotydeus destructor]|nr:hypothetical protein HDE_10807 [Halotydeus destructor]